MDQRRTCLVTGGTSGIGLEVARRFVRDGHDVWTCSTTAIAGIQEPPPQPERHLVVDFRDPGGAVTQLTQHIKDIDILVNNAGIGTAAPLAETTESFVSEMLAINLVAPILLMRAFVPAMVARGFGRVINISSISGKFGNNGRLAYASSKHGLIGASRCVSDEVASAGVTVNTVCPGPTDTRMLREIAAVDPDFISKVTALIKIGRLVQPKEIASMVAFLSSSEADAITGQSFVVDGGVIQS